MNRRVEYEDREINLLHLICYLLEKYKSLIVVLVIGAVLGLGIGMIAKTDPVAQEEIEDAIEEEEYEPTEEVKQNMEIAYQYRKLFEQQKEYNDNSIIMQVDSNKLYEGRVSYYITNNGDEGEISAAYTAIIEDEAFLEKIAIIADSEPSYIREVIGAGYARSSFSEETNIAAGVITYSVIHFDEEICREILDCLMEQVEIYHQRYREKYNNYEFRKITDVLTARTNNGYVDRQNGYVGKLNTFNNTMVSLESKFTDEDLTYYQIHYLNEKEVSSIDKDEVTESDVTVQDVESNTVKYIIIGVGIAGILWAVFWGMKYLFDNRIYTKEEVERRYGIPVVGYVCADEQKKKLYQRWKRNSYDSKESLEYTLNTLCDKGVVVCGVKETEGNASDVIYYADYLWKNPKVMEKAKKIGSVIIGINLEKSTYDEVDREIEMCMVQNIEIIGIIVCE